MGAAQDDYPGTAHPEGRTSEVREVQGTDSRGALQLGFGGTSTHKLGSLTFPQTGVADRKRSNLGSK